MAHGNDVSGLFADVIKNMQTDDLELKKLVYLYLATNARTKPTLVVLAVNTFVKVIAMGKEGSFILYFLYSHLTGCSKPRPVDSCTSNKNYRYTSCRKNKHVPD